MKYTRLFYIAIIPFLVLTACDKKDDESTTNPITIYSRSVTLDAKGTQQTMTLYEFNNKISNIENDNAWLVVYASYYTFGSPDIVLKATVNTSKQQRQGSVTINATNGDKVILSVKQEGDEEQKTDIDNLHDAPTDKPAYIKQGA